MSQTAELDRSAVPDSEMTHLARSTLRAVERYFEIPGVREEYELWLKKRKTA